MYKHTKSRMLKDCAWYVAHCFFWL